MKKKFLFVLLIVFVVCLSLTLFSACDNGNKSDSSGAGGSISDASGNSGSVTVYSINFIADGAVYAKISTKGNEIVNLPANPEKDGYIFDGWYWDNEIWKKPFTANSLLDTPLLIDMHVYAKSTPITYTIEYELNGGENNSLNPTTYTIKSEEIVLQTPSKTGYDFIGWYSDEILTEKVEKISTGSSGDRKFYAKWIESIFKYTNNGKITGLYVDYETVIELDIPEAINGTTITGIFDSAFSSCSELKSVAIPKGVTSIGGSAFSGCKKLETIYYKGDLENWCEISGLSNIMSRSPTLYIDGKKVEGELVIPDSVQSIGESAFLGCTGLTSVTISDSVTSIGNSAFYNCTGLTSVTIPDSVTSMGNYAFCGCSGLISVTISDSITSIGSFAFYGCAGLTNVTIPDSVKSMGDSAFWKCTGLTEIYYKDNIASWCGISGLENIMSSSRTLYIGGKKVEGDLVIPDSVKSIGDWAFRGCTGLTSVTIPDSVTSIGDGAFCDCTGLKSITIPDTVTSIGNSAFFGCIGLTSVTIPDSVTSIGSSAFSGCDKLTSVTIGNSVKSIGDGAFFGCAELTSVIIPDSVTNISEVVFYGCSNLTNVTIPDNVTSIGRSAFHGCTGLTSVTIPNSVTSIGGCAFYECKGLKTIYYKGTKERWDAIEKGWNWSIYAGNYKIIYNA